MSEDAPRLIWIDLEMTGLDPDCDRILEIATVITNEALEILDEGPVLAVHQPQAVLDRMDEWNRTHHQASGLSARVCASGVSEREAESTTLEFLRTWVAKGQSPMCGNSVCQDRRFLCRHMPELAEHFHYRNLDVSTLKELALRWYPGLARFQKRASHLARDDVYESIAELRYYREHLLVADAERSPSEH